MNDYEVSVTFKLSGSSDDDIFDIIDKIFEDNEKVWDLQYEIEQLTWVPELEDLE